MPLHLSPAWGAVHVTTSCSTFPRLQIIAPAPSWCRSPSAEIQVLSNTATLHNSSWWTFLNLLVRLPPSWRCWLGGFLAASFPTIIRKDLMPMRTALLVPSSRLSLTFSNIVIFTSTNLRYSAPMGAHSTVCVTFLFIFLPPQPPSLPPFLPSLGINARPCAALWGYSGDKNRHILCAWGTLKGASILSVPSPCS